MCLLADAIQADALFESVDRFENNLASSRANSPEIQEVRLLDESEYVALVSKLLEFSLTPKEWEKYKALVNGPLSIDHRPLGRGVG